MHFLMPHIFHSHAAFQDWFSNPLTGMVEGASAVNSALVGRLHAVLRPFVLRRMKQVCMAVRNRVRAATWTPTLRSVSWLGITSVRRPGGAFRHWTPALVGELSEMWCCC